MAQTETFDAVADFLCEHLGVGRHWIGETTSLADDLGVAGDDGDDLLVAFRDRFNIDMTGVEPGEYFGGEGFNPMGDLLVPLVKWLCRYPSEKLTPLTVADLVEIVERGSWFAAVDLSELD